MDTALFLQTLYERIPSGYAEIRLIQEGTGLIDRKWRAMPVGKINPAGIDRLHALNADGWHIYHRIGISQDQRARKADINLLPALYFDVDCKGDETPRDIVRRVANMPLVPDILINSGRGIHGYYLLTEPVTIAPQTLDRVERCMKGIAASIGGDSTFDVTRILRLPGFINVKTEYADSPPRCEVFDFVARHMWDFDRIYDAFYQWMPREAPAPTRTIPLPQSGTLPRWVETYLQAGAGRGERNNRAYAAARTLLDNGYSITETERLITARALSDGLKAGEVQSLLRSAERAPRGTPDMPEYMRLRMAAADRRAS